MQTTGNYQIINFTVLSALKVISLKSYIGMHGTQTAQVLRQWWQCHPSWEDKAHMCPLCNSDLSHPIIVYYYYNVCDYH